VRYRSGWILRGKCLQKVGFCHFIVKERQRGVNLHIVAKTALVDDVGNHRFFSKVIDQRIVVFVSGRNGECVRLFFGNALLFCAGGINGLRGQTFAKCFDRFRRIGLPENKVGAFGGAGGQLKTDLQNAGVITTIASAVAIAVPALKDVWGAE